MMQTGRRIRRGLFVAYLIAVHALLIYFVGERLLTRFVTFDTLISGTITDPTESTHIPTPLPIPDKFADQIQEQPSPSNTTDIGILAIPVAGVGSEQLIDTYAEARSEERTHDAIDIPAPAGTPVVAALDGQILRFLDSERGGITIYQTTVDRRFVLYYAHLQRRAHEINVGTTVRKGTTIGYVGDTGNAGPGNYHLHFSIARITDPKRPWEGEYINPYPLLRYGQTLPQ